MGLIQLSAAGLGRTWLVAVIAGSRVDQILLCVLRAVPGPFNLPQVTHHCQADRCTCVLDPSFHLLCSRDKTLHLPLLSTVAFTVQVKGQETRCRPSPCVPPSLLLNEAREGQIVQGSEGGAVHGLVPVWGTVSQWGTPPALSDLVDSVSPSTCCELCCSL